MAAGFAGVAGSDADIDLPAFLAPAGAAMEQERVGRRDGASLEHVQRWTERWAARAGGAGCTGCASDGATDRPGPPMAGGTGSPARFRAAHIRSAGCVRGLRELPGLSSRRDAPES